MPSLKSIAVFSLAILGKLVTAAALPEKLGDPREAIEIVAEEHREVEPAVILEEHEHEHDVDFEPDVVIEEHVEHQYEEVVEQTVESHPAFDTVHWCINACRSYCATGAYYEGAESISGGRPIENCDFNYCTAQCVVTGIMNNEENLKTEVEEIVDDIVYVDEAEDLYAYASHWLNKKRDVNQETAGSAASEFYSYASSSDFMNADIAAHPSPLHPVFINPATSPTSPPASSFEFSELSQDDPSNWLKPANSKADSVSKSETTVDDGKGHRETVDGDQMTYKPRPETADEVWLSGVCNRVPSRVDGSIDGNMKKYYFNEEGLEVLVHRAWRNKYTPGLYPPPRKQKPDEERDAVDVENSKLLKALRTLVCV
ncbi:hypothetical protein QBC43DRAFT_292106 [Cladorrhinum sp. PSN259]|nr:hypothetical protein QBC43DRAFT_292106 [Cladorrhinum sp. PSN259]